MKKLLQIIFLVLVILVPMVQVEAAHIRPALEEGFGAEGGKNCRRDDPGNRRSDGTWGCTMYGISPKTYGYAVPNNITGAEKIYERDFWKPLHLEDLDNQIVANAIFLAAINQGLPTWTKKFQEAINLSNGLGEDIPVDGVIGPRTISAANKCDQIELYINIIILQGQRYQEMVRKHPNMKGWYRDLMYRMRNGVRKAVHDYDRLRDGEAPIDVFNLELQ